MKNKILLVALLVISITAHAQLSGVYSIGTGNVPGEVAHYASLKLACDAINTNSGTNITGDCTFYITSNLTETDNVSIGANTNGHTITFKPYTGTVDTITFTKTTDNTGLSGGWIIGVKNITTTSATNYGVTQNDSTEHIVIDGSNTVGGTTRDLTIRTATGVHGNTNPIRVWGNCNYITIKNIVVTTGQSVSYAILFTVRQTTTAGYAGNYVPDNFTVENCDVTNTFGSAGQGIAISNSGTPTQFPTSVVFKNNKVTATTRGIFLNYAGNTDVFGNQIYLNQTGSGSLSEGIYAFVVGSSTNVTNIYNNKILLLSTANVVTGTAAGIEGIWIGTQGIYNIYNNFVTGFNLPNNTQGIHTGIGILTGTTNGLTVNVYNNSVYMKNGSNTAGATPPIQTAFYLDMSGASGTRIANVKNNIFVNDEPDYATQAMYVTTTNKATLTSDYNVLYTAGGSGKIGKYGATDCATLADWQAASSQDANSKSGTISFTDSTNLHINPNTKPVSIASNAGTPISGITTDIDGDTRSLTTPDIGADEYLPLVGISSYNSKTVAFGNVTVGLNKIDNSVTVTNSGGATLNISAITSNEAQVTVSPTTATLAAGASQVLQVTYTPTAGSTIASRIVITSDGSTTSDTIAISGTGILPSLSFSSATKSFGTVIKTVSKKDSVTVTNNGPGDLIISSVTSNNADFTVTPNGANTITSGNSTKYYITFTPATNGTKSGYIIFNHNNVTKPKDSVAVDGVGSDPGFGLSATSKDIGNVRKAKSRIDSVIVSNSGTVAINISSVTSDNTEFVVSPTSATIQPSANQKFTITLTPTALGLRSANIVFTHDGSFTDTVKVKGTGVFPAFAMRSKILNQGDVGIGKSKTDSVYILNTGTDTLHLDSLYQNRAEFSVKVSGDTNYVTVAPADSKKVYIKFSPTVLGVLKDTLVVYHDGPSLRDTIFVSANGGEPIFALAQKILSYGSVLANATKKDSVVVTNSGSIDLKIDSVKSDNGMFTVTPNSAVIAASGTSKFYVSFTPTSIGAKSGKIIFYHNASSVKDTLSVSGTSVQAAFTISTKTLSVSSAVVNTVKKDSVAVSNTGTFQLTISSVVSTNAEFVVSPTSATIDTSKTQQFSVTFTPVAAGVRTGKIIFNHNAGSISDTIAVSGSGIAITNIKTARNAPNGTEVAFIGIVTRTKGSYTYLQDDSAGIIVYQSSGGFRDTVAHGFISKGDRIRIHGKTSEFNSLKEIAGTDLVSYAIGTHNNPLPTPKLLTLKQVAATGENYEAMLIRVPSLTIVTADTVFAAAKTYSVKDPTDTTKVVSLRMPNASDGDVDGMKVLPKLVTFTGVLGQFNSSNPAAGYQLMAIDSSDIVDNVLSVYDPFSGIPESYELHNNYPNPFNPSTTILYGLPKQSRVTVKIYSILGQEVTTLVNDVQSPSYYRVVWNGTNSNGSQVSSGVYFVRITAESGEGNSKPFIQIKKMMLMK